MKKVISCMLAVLLMVCAVASVSAAVSPTASVGNKYIKIDAYPVPDDGGVSTPDLKDPDKYELGSGETITLVATPKNGYKFSHWKFITGEFDVVEGNTTTPTIVILPTGEKNIRLEANFVKEDEPITTPTTQPVSSPDTEPTAPITGDVTNATNYTALYIVLFTVIAAAGVGVTVIAKKRHN